jgi:hypothetical protein
LVNHVSTILINFQLILIANPPLAIAGQTDGDLRMRILSGAVASAAAAIITASSASAVVMDFGAATAAATSIIVVNQNGYSVSATAKGVDAAGLMASDNALVKQTGFTSDNEGGFGVVTANDTNHEIDGGVTGSNIHKDMLLLTFASPVKITGISFSRVDADDDVILSVDGAIVETLRILTGWPNFHTTSYIGTTFGFAALGQDDNFKLRAIEVTPIPLPPAFLAFATSLFGFLAVRRKQK